MSSIVNTGDFFVAAGPVQPDDLCYIERDSDAALCQSLQDQNFCYVLSQRSSGKSSLMARTIQMLRAQGQVAAVVDLTQIASRGESEEPGRWYYNIAYRIVRELRLKVDLQGWWKEKSVLRSDERLAEFFWEIVLTNTAVPITIFFDQIELAVDLPFSKDLFTAIRSCYNSRTTEPDLGRLNFVVLGAASTRQLAPDRTVSPFDLGIAIELNDFTVEETYQLIPGFPSKGDHAKLLLDKIYRWASGQPYLTQKIARGVVRRGARSEDVETVVHELFLAQGARREEPLLNQLRALLTRRAPRNRQALALLGRIGKGSQIPGDSGSTGQQLLSVAGLSAIDDEGMLILRNQLFSTVFNPRWVSSLLPFNWRAAAVAAIAAGFMTMVPWWYTQILPQPYIESMSSVSQPINDAYFTYQRLHRLPGFGVTADRLFTDVLVHHSRLASTFAEIQIVDGFLRDMLDREQLAEELKGDYWLRRAVAASRTEKRDEALLLASAAIPGQGESARALVTELIGSDYHSLQRSFRLAETPAHWEVDWEAQEIVIVTGNNRVRRLSLNGRDSNELANGLTALQHLAVRREVSVDEPGSAGAFLLELDIVHAADEQILVSLEAPNGVRAGFTLPANGLDRAEFEAVGISALANLADADRQGVWRLTLVDREVGFVGELVRWGLSFSEELRGWIDDPEPNLIIPDPGRSNQVDVTISPNGQLAVALPSRSGTVGTLALWDIRSESAAVDLELDMTPEFLILVGRTSRLIAVAGNTLTLWDTDERLQVGRVATQTGFLLPPVVGGDGDYIAIAEQLDFNSSLYSLLRTQDGELVTSITGVTGVRDWILGPQARYLALLGSVRDVQLMDPRRGDILAELPHDRPPVRLIPASAGDRLVSIDNGGDIFVWNLSNLDGTTPTRRLLGVTVDPASVSVATDGSMVAFEAAQGHVVARDIAGESEPFNLRVHRDDGGIRTRLAPDGGLLITASGGLLQLWQLEDRKPGSGTGLDLSALALDRSGRVAALGFRDGNVSVLTTSQLENGGYSQEEVDYIGHQGSVSSIVVDTLRGSVVSGGDDGTVRIWDIASGAPLELFMRHAAGPVNAVALSPDGQWILSAAESSARLWNIADGELATQVITNGAALAVSFSPQAERFVVGDSVGNLFFESLKEVLPRRLARAQDSILALAHSPDGEFLASGDMSGRVQLWDPESAAALGEPWKFPHPIRWIGFTEGDGYLIVQTDHWLHRLLVESQTLSIYDSRMLEVGTAAGVALATSRGEQLRLVGGRGLGRPIYYELDLSKPATLPLPEGSPLLERDWPGLLGLQLDATGAVVLQ